MTTEEKARAYDEAMNKVKPLYEQAKKDGNPIWSTYEYLIPELVESKDERIRKEIIDFIQWAEDRGMTRHDYHQAKRPAVWIAYLEKQKEQIPYTDFVIKPHKGDDNNPYDMRVSEAQEYAIKRGFGIPFNDGEVYVDERHMTQTIGNILRWADEHPKEQKPAEPSGKPSRQEYLYHLLANGVITFSDYEFLLRNKGRKPADLSEMMVHKEPYIAPVPTPMVADEQKPIKMEVYEVGKGTTICGQDYKCKKDYKEGNCWYIKDAVYHCSRDGYLTDQNGISWSCTPEWFKEYIQSNTEWAEEEKTHFVSGQFLQCKLSFDGFKEGEHYWLEYVGNDMYVGRSDNILNQKFHITPRQLFTLFSQELEEVQGPPQEEKQVSLNYEPPFDENPSDKEIVEALIKHLKEQDGFLTAIDSVSTKAILSWLEKQKEQKHTLKFKVGDKVHLEGDDVNILTITGIEKDRYLTDNSYGPILFGAEDIWERIEQKPTEWSEEDEKILQSIIKDFRAGKVSTIGQEQWLKSLPERFNLQLKKKLSIEKAIQWLDYNFYFWDNSSGRGKDCEITTRNFDSLEEMYDSFRKAVIVDSEQKDLALTWKDMKRIIRIEEEMMDDPEVHPEWKEEQPYYEEVLRRFNKAKEEKK